VTIPNLASFSSDASELALRALAWVLADEGQLSVLDFLCAHEPDLLAAADALAVPPAELAAARERLAP
jgi:hypothetical protein